MLEYLAGKAPRDVILVHGAGGNNLLWRRSLQYLSGGATAFAVNLPGHPSGEIVCRSIPQYSEALRGFIDERGLRRPVLCGHSMGSAVVLTYAIEHPDSLEGLILVSSGAKLGVDPAIIDGLGQQPLGAIERLITPRSFYRLDLGLGREARAALSVSNLPIFLNDYLACQGFDARAELGRVTVPALILCGDKDKMTPPKWAHYLHERITGSELYFVKDSGHMLPLEKPEPMAAIIQSFLERLTR